MDGTTEAVWTEFGERLRSFIAVRVGNQSDAEDILQDVFLRVYAHLDTLADEQRLMTWVYQIARNAIVDHHRRRRPMAPLPEAIAAPEAPPDDLIPELLPGLATMLGRLSPEDQQALILTEVEGLTQREVADRLGLSLSGAKSRVQRARKKLRHAFVECCRVELDRLGGVASYLPGCDACHADPDDTKADGGLLPPSIACLPS